MLEQFFAPSSVAVVGAAREEGKVGHEILDNLIASGFKGELYPVNPRATEIHGRRGYRDLAELPRPPDLAVIVVPSAVVAQVIEACGRRGTKAAIVITAGFKETGIEGRRLENQVLEVARSYDVRIIGPNCLGLIDTATPINASFAQTMPAPGHIAFISQSGALCTAILDWAKGEELGFSKFVSFGNRADISEIELIEYFARDPQTKVIAAYLEGVKDGPAFIRTVRQATRHKPVVLYKSGGTTAGARAVSSHTGSLAGSESAYRAAFYQSGALHATSVESLFTLSLGLAYQPLPPDEHVAILTNAGGPGIITTDACERLGIPLATLSDHTTEALRQALPPAANCYNPVDILGDALSDRYRLAADLLLSDPHVGALICILTPQAMTPLGETAEVLIEVSRDMDKPIVTVFMGKADVADAVRTLSRHGIPNYSFPEQAVETLSAMIQYGTYRARPEPPPPRFEVEGERARAALNEVREEGRTQLGEFEARSVLRAYGIRTPRTILAAGLTEARRAAQEIGYPVVLKIASPDILHKSDVGGVRVDLGDEEALTLAYEEVVGNARRLMPRAILWGVTVQEMLPLSAEMIVGMNKDPQFGHLLMVGWGGIYVEVLRDVAFRVLPIAEPEAREMVTELRAYRLLQGVRGQPPADVDALIEVLLRLSQLACDIPHIVEMDINPLKVYGRGDGCTAADARIVIGG